MSEQPNNLKPGSPQLFANTHKKEQNQETTNKQYPFSQRTNEPCLCYFLLWSSLILKFVAKWLDKYLPCFVVPVKLVKCQIQSHQKWKINIFCQVARSIFAPFFWLCTSQLHSSDKVCNFPKSTFIDLMWSIFPKTYLLF